MVFVTGGTGLLGSHLLIELAQQHDKITAIYRQSSKIEMVKRCFLFYLGEKGEQFFRKITWIEADILDVPKLEDTMKGHEIVYHCAGFVSFARQDFANLIEINRVGTTNMVNVALAIGVKKFCYVSSISAVGEKDIPANELITEGATWILTKETSGYSISKYGAEREVWRAINEGLNAVIVNPGIVFGAGDWNSGSMAIFKQIASGLRFYPSGANAFVDARDVAKIMVSLLNENVFHQRFICVAENRSFKDVCTLIAEKLDKKPPTKAISPFLMNIVWRIAAFLGGITFSKPKISKSTALNSMSIRKYSNQKVKSQLNYNFFPLEETVENAVKFKEQL